MPTLDINDPSTWTQSVLNTPVGPIDYWVLADWENYYEAYEDDANMTRVLIAVNWLDAGDFKRYALGFAEKPPSTQPYLVRYTPLQCPYQANQFLRSLRKHSVHAGLDPVTYATAGKPSFAFADPLFNNWPNFDFTDGMQARIVYDAVFTCPKYDIIPQDHFLGAGYKEMKRFVIREEQMNARERRAPDFGYELVSDPTKKVPEVGVLPYIDYEFTLTWTRVPNELVPYTAISNCAVKVNNAAFDYVVKGATPDYLTSDTYGRFLTGDLLFKGLAYKTVPYRGTNGEWLRDLPYLLSYQPADGTGNGQLKIPLTDLTWALIQSTGTHQPLYGSANLETLFQPEP